MLAAPDQALQLRLGSALKLYSYVVDRDFGFAPNPFFGVCTLATCKPRIRNAAKRDDWVIGTGGARRKRRGALIYAMRVTDALTFNDYFNDPRFTDKKPNLQGSKKRAFGDNIYCRDEQGVWHQLNSHHSFEDGSCNFANVANDTQADRVLISTDFTYFGADGPQIPAQFRNYGGVDICAGRGHKCNFPPELVRDFIAWFRSLDASGFIGRPLEWSKTP